MKIARALATVLGALALVLAPASALPAAAAAGYHAAYFSESSFLTLSPGQSGQFAVGFANTGDQGWVKGTSGQASLHTAAPLDNPTDFTNGWSVNWTSPSIYTIQSTDLVAPGQVGFFIYNIKVPSTAPAGVKNFYGRPAVESVGFLEDYGYYQAVNVQLSTLAISGSTPASPSPTTTPVINGTGAVAGATVTVSEGTTSLCTATAAAGGTWSCTTSVLASGAHSLVASSVGQGNSAPFTYTVGGTVTTPTTGDTTPPTVSSASTTSTASLYVNFSEAMKCATGGAFESIATAANYAIKTSPAGAPVAETITVTANTACTQATLILSNALTLSSSYTVTVTNVQDAAGNAIGSSNSATFTVTDSGVPTLTAAVTGAAQVTVTYSKPMNIATTGNGIGALANYALDSQSCTTQCSSIVVTPTTATVNFTAAPSTTGTHVFDVIGVKDAGGTTISPATTSTTLTFPSTSSSSRPTVTGVTIVNASKLTVTFSTNMDSTTAQTAANYSVQTNSTGNTFSTIATATCQPSTGACGSVDLVPTTPLTAGTYDVLIQNVKDLFNGIVNPNPTTKQRYQYAIDTSPAGIQSATATQTTLSVNFTKAMAHVAACDGVSRVPTAGTGGQIERIGDYSITTNTTNGTYFNTQLAASTGVQVSADCKTAVFTWTNPVPSGTYTLQVTAAQDSSGNSLNPLPSIVSVVITDSTAPTLTAAARLSATQFRVTFSEAMQGGAAISNSAGNPNNYSFDNGTYGALCASGGTVAISADATATQWTITCTGANGVWGANGTVTVQNVADQATPTVNIIGSTSPGGTGQPASRAF